MATSSARMSYTKYYQQQQNGKFATLPHGSNKDADATYDMHHKMSKKIAQLTKVIYALNTKKDEHDAQVQHLQEQHEQELERLAASTKQKLLACEERLAKAESNVEQIAELEQAVQSHRQEQEELLQQQADYKHSMQEKFHQQEINFSQKIWEFSGELLESKKDFQEQLQDFELTKKKMKTEHERMVEQLHKHYQEEINNLMTAKSAGDDECAASMQQMQQYQQELDQWKFRFAESEDKLKQTNDEWESKLEQSQASFDKELSLSRQVLEAEKADALNRLRAEKEELRQELEKVQTQLKTEVQRLETQLSETKDQAEKYEAQLALLVSELQHREGNFSEQHFQLKQLEVSLAEAKSKTEELEKELVEKQQTLLEKTTTLLHQTTVINNLEAEKIQKDVKVQDLNEQLQTLQVQIDNLKQANGKLETRQQEHKEKNSEQFKNLQDALKDALCQKLSLETKHTEEIAKLKAMMEEKEQKWREEMEKLAANHKEEMDALQLDTVHQLHLQKQEMEKEVHHLKQGNKVIAEEYEKVGQELKDKLTEAEKEIQRFESLVQNSEDNLISASSHITALKEASSQLKDELDNCRQELKTAKNTNTQLQSELEKTAGEHQAKLAQCEKDFQQNMKHICDEAERKSKENIRISCAQVRQEVSEAKDTEKELALRELELIKNEEIREIQKKLQKQEEITESEISLLRAELEQMSKIWSAKLEEEKSKMQMQTDEMEKNRLETISNFEENIRQLERTHAETVDKLKMQHEKNIKEIHESKMCEQNASLNAVQIAHEAILNKLKDEHCQAIKFQQEKMQQEFEKNTELLKEKLNEKHRQALCQQVEIQVKEMAAIKGDLDELEEISKNKDKDYLKETEKLRKVIEKQEKHATDLTSEVEKFQKTINELLTELDGKKKDFEEAKIEHQHKLRELEERMLAESQKEKENLQEDHCAEMQQLVTEFNWAQEMLKNKISVLNMEVLQCEERFKNRESRPEDLEEICKLRNSITDRELQMKKFQDEKRFFQMELINRETNFNKIFGSSPQVGVINPLINKKTKNADKNLRKFTSAPSLQQQLNRLEHLQTPSIHDEDWNPTKPLPSMQLPPLPAKKYVK